MWSKFDDQFYMNPKIVMLSRDEQDLYMAAIIYCNGQLTDGYIPEKIIPMLAAWSKIEANAQAIASSLVDSCLWELADKGYQIHDFLDWNMSKAEVLALKSSRSEAGKRGGLKSVKVRKAKKADAQAIALANAQAKLKQNPTQSQSQSPLKDSGAEAPKEPPAEEEPAPAPSIIKNQGAYNALLAHEQNRRNGKPDVSWLSEHLRPLAEMFITESSIVPLKGEHKFWIRSIGNLYDIGAKPDHIKKAIRKMRGDGLTIKSPESCLANIRDELARSVQPDNINWK